MIAEALKYFADKVSGSEAPKKLDAVSDARTAVYAIGAATKAIDVPPSPRGHAPKCLGDVVELANRFAQGATRPVVWYDESAVVLVIDDDGHRVERATLALEVSDVFARLVKLRRSPEMLDPIPFQRLLRVDLAGTLDPGVLLAKVRRVRFENGVAKTTEASREKHSLGTEIMSKIEAGLDVPESVTLQAPVYKTLGLTDRIPVNCAVEMDPPNGKLQLLPLPDEIERVQHVALAGIAQELRDTLNDTVPCYYGKP